MRRLDRVFFAAESPTVAPLLLNKLLVVGECVGRISEVEAYRRDDPASHSFRGRTPRNGVMFGPAGHLYVYISYGIHRCANVVTGDVDDAEAVLLRAVIPVDGVDVMQIRRGRDRDLTNGPGKLCQAFAIDMELNGIDLCDGDGPAIFDDGTPPPIDPLVTPRIGITVGVDTLWRWVLAQPPASQRIPAP